MNDNNDKNLRWYRKTYNSLIERARPRGLKRKTLDFYTEKHHIIPRCMGGDNKPNNLVLLTFREHIIAHRLLVRMYPEDDGLKCGLLLLVKTLKNPGDFWKTRGDSYFEKFSISINTRELEELRLASSRKTRKALLGSKWREDTKEEIIKRRVGRIIGKEGRSNISKSLVGQEISKETGEKQSKNRTSIIKSRTTGETWVGISSFCEHFSIHENTARFWINKRPEKGFYYEKVKKSLKVMDDKGIIYKSITECAKRYNRDSKTIKKWATEFPHMGFKLVN